ncbi:MAG: hypothetical protein WBO77_04260 [Microgenomates group bacterium]
MKPFTIEEKIKIIFQNKPAVRDALLLEYPKYDEVRKSDVIKIITEQYSTLFDDLAIIKYEQFMEEVSAGTRQLSNDMMQQAYQVAHEDLREILSGKHQDNQEIKALQQKIQSLSVAS